MQASILFAKYSIDFRTYVLYNIYVTEYIERAEGR